jgi:nucleoside diphosphate-linked moiety X motif protein 19
MTSTDKIRKAATLIINCASEKNASYYNYKTMLLKRSSNMKFAPNRYVFPGGAYEHDQDASLKWLDVFFKHQPESQRDKQKFFSTFMLSSKQAKRPNAFKEVYDSKSYLPPEISYRLCALRETFEETGLLLARNNLPDKQTNYSNFIKHAKYSPEIEKWFDKVNQNPTEFLNMFNELNLVPDIFSLYEWSNWLTPSFETSRFDALFFICCLQSLPGDNDLKLDINENQHLEVRFAI